MFTNIMLNTLFFCDCCDNQTWWLQAADTYSLHSGHQKSVLSSWHQRVSVALLTLEALGENTAPSSCSFRWLPAFLGRGLPRSCSSLCGPILFSSSVYETSHCLPPIKHPWFYLVPTRQSRINSPSQNPLLSHICKAPFHVISLTGSRDEDLKSWCSTVHSLSCALCLSNQCHCVWWH